jgi:hypothetical protein
LTDVVLIVLKDALNTVAPLKLDREEVQGTKTEFVHASYSADRRHVLTGHFGCLLLAQNDGLWFTDCDTHAASSGGPLLIQRDGDLKLAGLIVGVASKSASIAVPALDWIEINAQRHCP